MYEDKIAVIEQYLEHFSKDYIARENLDRLKYLDALGLEDRNYYFWMGGLVVNEMITVRSAYHITNPSNGVKDYSDGVFVIWGSPCGRLEFFRDDYYQTIGQSWQNFKNKCLSYNPICYDEINEEMLFDVESGARLIKDYPQIKEEFIFEAKKQIKEAELREIRKKFDKLKTELEAIKNA